MPAYPKILTFSEFSRLWAQTETLNSLAGIHGILCGFVCVGRHLDGSFCLDNLLKHLKSRACWWKKDFILSLYGRLCRQLNGSGEGFNLLLPNSQHTLSDRIRALSCWCQGFLYGLGSGTSLLSAVFSKDIYEALYCITEVAQFDCQGWPTSRQGQSIYDEALAFLICIVPVIYEGFSDALSIYQSESALVYLH